MDNARVKCSWHGSVFSLENASGIDGPATQHQPKYEMRIRDRKILVKLAESEIIKRLDTEDQS